MGVARMVQISLTGLLAFTALIGFYNFHIGRLYEQMKHERPNAASELTAPGAPDN